MATANRMIQSLVLYTALAVQAVPAIAQDGTASARQRDQEVAKIVPGAAALDPAGIRAHEATWRLVQVQSGNALAAFRRTVELVHHTKNEPAILAQWHFTTPQRSGLDIYYLDRESLMPLARYVTAPNGMWVQYQSSDRLVVSLTRRTGGEPVYIDTESPGPRFNNAMLDFVLASLPLAVGYTASWPTLGTSGASVQEALETVRAQVEGGEAVALPNGETVEAWRVRVERSNGNTQIVWIANDPPYLLRRDILRNGTVTVRWELTSVTAH